MTLRFLTPAFQEFGETVGNYHEIGSELSTRYQTEAKRVIDLIVANPERFRLRHDPFRYAKFRNFSYHFVYSIRETEIIIVAVAHTSRKPGYRLDRLSDSP